MGFFTHGQPELPTSDQCIYFDIEGIPDRNLYYLIGALVDANGHMQHHSFWADDDTSLMTIFKSFCEFVATFPNAKLFHFGSYDLKALKEIRAQATSREKELVGLAIDSCCNVLLLVHSHCYFPLYSVRLRQIASFLGCQLSSRIHAGLDSIIFREQWENSRDEALRKELLEYNAEDCMALKTVCDFLRRSASLAAERHKVPGREEEVASSESLRKIGEGKRPVFRKAEFALPEFELANRCSYFDYQRDRLHVRTSKKTRTGHQLKRLPQTSKPRSKETDVVVRCDQCPGCGSKRLNRTIYGHGLLCWCVYHNIIGKESMLQTERSLYDVFGLKIPFGHSYRFRSALASYYHLLYDEILHAIVNDSVINIDETQIKLRDTVGYVWVFASSNKVYYLYMNSREGTFLHELLRDFSGVLVSDFFTAYDSLACRHQKCLLHLMRDINDDLRSHPYDMELRFIAD